jgi:urease accessory protein
MTSLALLQLVSPALPVGAFSYSEGLEVLVQTNGLNDEQGVQDWLTAELSRGSLRLEVAALPKLRQQLELWVHRGDVQGRHGVQDLDGWLLATREASELKAQQRQMGQSLLQLLDDLGHPLPETVRLSWPAAWAWAASAMKIPVLDMLEGYLYGWVANQLSAAGAAGALGSNPSPGAATATSAVGPTAGTAITGYGSSADVERWGWGFAHPAGPC